MLRLLKNLFSGQNPLPEIHYLPLVEMSSYDAYIDYKLKNSSLISQQRALERALITGGDEKFSVPGYCTVCNSNTKFSADYENSYEVDGILMPNWRERLICPACKLNNRLRAATQIFQQKLAPDKTDAIYITEQTTPFYSWLNAHFTNVTGSEYLGDKVSLGNTDSNGIRNENCTALSFKNSQLDHILSFDVLEHIFNYKKALKEFQRCLRQGGKLLLSVPFEISSRSNIVRAIVDENGNIDHILPAEYHGDPINSDGCLCYYHFGWQLLNDLRDIGFTGATALLYWSSEYGYLGKDQVLFFAQKA